MEPKIIRCLKILNFFNVGSAFATGLFLSNLFFQSVDVFAAACFILAASMFGFSITFNRLKKLKR